MSHNKIIIIVILISAVISGAYGVSSTIQADIIYEPSILPIIEDIKDKETPEVLEPEVETVSEIKTEILPNVKSNFEVPFYSQFNDISEAKWKKLGCGIASLAMIIEYYTPGKISVDTLLDEGFSSGAYLNNVGWIHNGLVRLSNNYGLGGKSYDLSSKSMDFAFGQFEKTLKEGPVIASIYYTFDPQSPIPHLVVINGIDGDIVYYNDPSDPSGGETISIDKFKIGWKKRYIEIRPAVS